MAKYQLIILPAQNKAINVPVTKKGPKGNWLFNFFFPANISPIPTRAPNKKAKNKETNILGKPKNRPMRKPSLASPKPIHLPRDINQIRKKNPPAPTALNIKDQKLELNSWKL